MENLFSFEYQEVALFNNDRNFKGKPTKSNFRQVFGLDGKNVACPKGSYHIVKTADVSTLGHAFLDKGYNVNTFNHRNGESIGLNVSFGNKPSKVGESTYNLIITVPNNGGGKGYLAIKQERLICTNGMIQSKLMHKDSYIKIPHTIDYKDSLVLMQKSIEGFVSLLEQVEQRDILLDGQELSHTEIMFNLNKWFYEQEMPRGHKTDMSFDEFRKLLAINPNEIKSIDRYNELKKAFNTEMEYNAELGLNASMYTVYASVTNYLSRRVEISKSTASNEVQIERSSKKLSYFDVF